jgi:chromate transporter
MKTKIITYKALLLIYLKIGANAYGGWSTTYLLLEQEFAIKRRLLSKEQLQTAVASGQALPGPAQVIIAAQTSYFLKGVKGSVLATLCYLVPSLVLTIGFCFVYFSYLAGNTGRDYTIGIQAAVGGIIIGNAYKIARSNATMPILWLAAGVASLLYAIFNVPTFLIIVLFGVTGIIITLVKKKSHRG